MIEHMDTYVNKLSLFQTQKAIKKLKDFFERQLAYELNLTRISAPLFVQPETGLNDNLNGTEKPVSFSVFNNNEVQIVQSLAKWKRMALYKYNIKEKAGIYTDMNAIRKDEEPDYIHSYYVDQWDWERVIGQSDRNELKLKEVVERIYKVLKITDEYIVDEFPVLSHKLPETIFFISSQELENQYPDLTSKQREHEICKKYKAVFIFKIGKKLLSGKPHDGRSPDYDDWELNGDILLYNPVSETAFELSSMGIRVDKESLLKQLEETNTLDRLNLEYHQAIVNDVLPLTIGGGIGQSRLCMYFLEKAHIGEVQSSVWPKSMIKECKEKNIHLL
ncbi:aspartate--ammonia ligase [Haloplasma contractile]|uniref:Aspartate--ammonia ligase n=1 Tax=Haloplasma contractile SSD-17B TaxID=1033810 RepID=F7Q133_9MOLU|nr:aspartate--ammonia ligase [Haloplasma contractile]ERJ11325.1 Aspartate--ammonia ligase protein [Haloplasma contractile SSD-17B]